MLIARLLTVALPVLVLTACTQQIWYREGASTAEVQRAVDACALQAAEQAPVRNQSRIVPGPIIPARKTCDAQGNCVVEPARQGFPQFETVDVNEDRRALIGRTCLAERGYDRVSLPFCDAQAKASVPAGMTRTLPRLTETSCIIPRGAAGYQIVSR